MLGGILGKLLSNFDGIQQVTIHVGGENLRNDVVIYLYGGDDDSVWDVGQVCVS